MSVKHITLVNEALLSVESGAVLFKIATTDGIGTTTTAYTSDGTARTAEAWVAEIQSIASSSFSSMSFKSSEFVTVLLRFGVGEINKKVTWAPQGGTANDNVAGSQADLDATALMLAIGAFQSDTPRSQCVLEQANPSGNNNFYQFDRLVNFYSTISSWGTHRLILQGSSSTDTTGREWLSRMMAPERITGKNNNNTFESIGYVINSYDKRFDLKRWNIPCRWLGTGKEQWVKDFIDEAVNGKNSDNVVLYGDEHWIKSTETWKVLADQYQNIETDLGHALLVKFNIGLREVQ